MTKSKILLLTLAAVVLITACGKKQPDYRDKAPQTMLVCDHAALAKYGQNQGPALIATAYHSVSAIPLGAVVISDTRLFHQTMAQAVFSSVTERGTIKATVRFANCTPRAFNARARTHFLDENGAPAESATGWKTVYFNAGVTAVYEETSFKREDKVKSFYVELVAN